MIRHGLHYIPSSVAEDPAKKEYGAWAIEGTIIVTEGDTTDQPLIRDHLLFLAKQFNVLAIAFDPHQAHMLVTELQQEGLPCIEVGMTVLNLSEPMKQLDADIIDGKLRHNCGPQHPMTWQISNVVAKLDAKDNVYPRKEREELKIDGPVALIIARAQMTILEAEGLVGGPTIQVW
jgi:phage terminase large subunit-like protein